MNLRRFLNKCVNDRAAAVRSVKLVSRSLYGRLFWFLLSDITPGYNVPPAARCCCIRVILSRVLLAGQG
jgi:hypothetical protein